MGAINNQGKTRMSDDDIKCWIEDTQLAQLPASAALRRFRATGRSCSGRRFRSLHALMASLANKRHDTMTTDMLKKTKGNKAIIDFDGRRTTFTAGGRKRYLIEEYDTNAFGPIGFVMVNGKVRFADGTEAYCVLEIDESSSGSHSATGVFLPSGEIIFQDDPNFLTAIGKTKEQVFPYRYKYTGPVHTLSDHHIGNDGWSL